MPTRREFVALSAAFSIMPLSAASARSQVAGIYSRGVGDIRVTAILDGYLQIDPKMLVGSNEAQNAELLEMAFLAAGPVDTSINTYVIESGDRTVVVDSGAAGAFGPTTGRMKGLLGAAGVDVAKVDTVFVTHLHPDHAGGLAEDGSPVFANAELALHPAEREFWTNEANFAGANERTQKFAAVARGAVAAYGDNVNLLDDGGELAPGITVKHLPGHTPGHSGLMLSSGDASMLLWADIVHVGPIQFARPAVTIPFDVDQSQAAATRAQVLDMAATDRLEIAGSHVDFPSFGHVAKAGEGYAFIPSRWDHDL